MHSHCQNVRHVRNIDLYLTRLALVPLCLHVAHSVRTSSGFFFFSADSASLLPGRLPLLGAEESALDSTLGFCWWVKCTCIEKELVQIECNLSKTDISGTEETFRCSEVAVTGRWGCNMTPVIGTVRHFLSKYINQCINATDNDRNSYRDEVRIKFGVILQ